MENYYLSYDTVIVADGRRSSVKSYDWRSITSKTLLIRWLAQASSGLKFAQRKKLTNCDVLTWGWIMLVRGINNTQTWNKFNSSIKTPIVIPFLFSVLSCQTQTAWSGDWRAWKAATPKLK
jgi:hypothetical protein